MDNKMENTSTTKSLNDDASAMKQDESHASSSTTQAPLLALFELIESNANAPKSSDVNGAGTPEWQNQVEQLLQTQPYLATEQLEESGQSALMIASKHGHAPLVKGLLGMGAPWNALDRQGKCAGNYAVDQGEQECVDILVEAGVQAELILGMVYRLERAQKQQEASLTQQQQQSRGQSRKSCCGPSPTKRQRQANQNGADPTVEAQDAIDIPLEHVDPVKPSYLTEAVRYNLEDTALLDADNDAVMMEWERPLMSLHAQIITRNQQPQQRVLNVGFGMGIIDTELQKTCPSKHVIIEAHPAVYQRMIKDGWNKKPNVEVYFGKWQDVVPNILIQEKGYTFDGVFFDTYGEHWIDMEDFHSYLPSLLDQPQGVYSFFNGLAPDNVFFHGVSCQVLQLQLQKMGLETEFAPCEMKVNEKDWEGVRRKYWHGNTYYLPICTWKKTPMTKITEEGESEAMQT
jgi:protein arginine N-methyltransferase 2